MAEHPTAPRDRPHILIRRSPDVEPFTSRRLGGGDPPPPPMDGRVAHGHRLLGALHRVRADVARERAQTLQRDGQTPPGSYVLFESRPGVPLNLSGLERLATGAEVIAVYSAPLGEAEQEGREHGRVTRATVFVPGEQSSQFFQEAERRLEKYSLSTPPRKKERRYHDMADRIGTVRGSTLFDLWTDDRHLFPSGGNTEWWEVWLRDSAPSALARFRDLAAQIGVELAEGHISFHDRTVTLLHATEEQLAHLRAALGSISEIRLPKSLAPHFLGLATPDQAELVKGVLKNLHSPLADSPAVCLLDTGVNRGHPLLAPALATEDAHAVVGAWLTHDNGGDPAKGQPGHGTQMAGVALFGDVQQVLGSQQVIHLRHRLESVKILPPAHLGSNQPELYGAVIAGGVARPEIQAPSRRRVFSLAVTSMDTRDQGRPTSWSATIDLLAFGHQVDATGVAPRALSDQPAPGRLFVVSAGNRDLHPSDENPAVSGIPEPIHDPAQAWNAITVGAFTDLAEIRDASFADWKPVARAGGLSPYSTTSIGQSPWPVKPDVVAEGGNAVVDANGTVDAGPAELAILTTYHKTQENLFTSAAGTSPAGAAVARTCARLLAEYPLLWPETIRGLVVHSARWTDEMNGAVSARATKAERERFLRQFGYGVTDEPRAMKSATDALTLIAQETIQPFDNDGHTKDWHVHHLPWPSEVLAELGAIDVTLRVTLSYFVEPNPAQGRWDDRSSYQSHALRFELIDPNETPVSMKRRLNRRTGSLMSEDKSSGGKGGWFFGPTATEKGSIHSDFWTGSAVELASRSVIAVHPVGGWWKEQPEKDRSRYGTRYALIVSIEAPGVATDIYTPVAQQVAQQIAVPTVIAATT